MFRLLIHDNELDYELAKVNRLCCVYDEPKRGTIWKWDYDLSILLLVW